MDLDSGVGHGHPGRDACPLSHGAPHQPRRVALTAVSLILKVSALALGVTPAFVPAVHFSPATPDRLPPDYEPTSPPVARVARPQPRGDLSQCSRTDGARAHDRQGPLE